MILGIGTDLVQINRIQKTLDKFQGTFEKKVFTQFEQDKANTLPSNKKASFFAKRFAAKEAFSKALGCGIGMSAFFQDIEIQNDKQGAPFFKISGTALQTLMQKTKGKEYRIHLSLTDEKEFAGAYVVIEIL